MNINQKRILEEHIYNLLKKQIISEQSKSKKKKDKSKKEKEENTGKKRKEVIAWLLKKSSDDTLSYVVNHAEIVRKLYNPKNKDEEDAYRSLFSRKLHQKDNGQGGVYTFSDKEINFIYSLMDNIL